MRWGWPATVVLLLAVLQDHVHAQAPKARWAKEPDSYRGVRWDALVSEPEAHERLREMYCLCDLPGKARGPCMDYQGDPTPATRTCAGKLTVGSIELDETWFFTLDRFAGAYLTFDSDDYDKLRAIFVERYGPPTQSADTPVQTRMGAKARNHILVWKGRRASITLQRYGDKITEGRALIGTHALMDRMQKASEDERREGAKVF